MQGKLLAELDATVHAIRAPFEFRKGDGTTVQRRLELLLNRNDPRVTDRNAAFTSFARASLFADPSECYELRVLPDGAIIEASYLAQVSDDGVFELEALKPGTAETA